MDSPSNNSGASNGLRASPPRLAAPTATVGETVPRIDEHGLIHGQLSPAPAWGGGLPWGQYDVVPPGSSATVARVLAEDSDGDGPLAFLETDEDLLQLRIQRSLRHEHREEVRRRRYQGHVDDFNERQLQRVLRADNEAQEKKKEWEAIAASQFQPAASSSCSSSDSSGSWEE